MLSVYIIALLRMKRGESVSQLETTIGLSNNFMGHPTESMRPQKLDHNQYLDGKTGLKLAATCSFKGSRKFHEDRERAPIINICLW